MSEADSRPASSPLIDSAMNTMSSRASTSATSLKRRASSSFEGREDDFSRKRIKEDRETTREDADDSDTALAISSPTLADDLAKELECGCCSELVYHPVLVNPCQHFFCGSCCVLWIRNGGTNCPACRGLSTIVTPFRALQSVVDTLTRAAPHKARAERERQQADEIYKLGQSMRIPPPREPSPEANIEGSTEYARPCPHCSAGNPYGWRCPQPIPDPNTDMDNAWPLEHGIPPGHAHCGNCENLLATRAPNTTTKCDLCQVYFCGIGVQNRCLALPLLAQQPHGLVDVNDLILSADVYDCFDGNSVEVDFMLDYLTAQRLTPRHIYREIITLIQSLPDGFKPLMELDLFVDVYGVASGADPNPAAPRTNICRLCAAEVFLWGLREWWLRERKKGFLEETIMSRQDCPEGRECGQQTVLAHAKEFNHIVPPKQTRPEQAPVQEMESEPSLPDPPTDTVHALPEVEHHSTGPVAPSVLDIIQPPQVSGTQMLRDFFDLGLHSASAS